MSLARCYHFTHEQKLDNFAFLIIVVSMYRSEDNVHDVVDLTEEHVDDSMEESEVETSDSHSATDRAEAESALVAAFQLAQKQVT